MAGKKKKLSRREQKRQKQQQKERMRRRTGWQEPEAPEMNWQLLEDLRPFLGRRDLEKGLLALAELAEDSGELVDEPEFESLFFPPMETLMLFAETLDENDLTAEEFAALPEELQIETFFQMMTQIMPQLLTDEFRETLLTRTETARTRFRDEGNEEKLLQTSAVQFVLEMQGDEEDEMYPGLLYMIASKTIDVGSVLIEPEDGEELSEAELEEHIRSIPGFRAYLDDRLRQAWREFIGQLMNGEIQLQLFTDAEIEEASILVEEDDGAETDTLGDYLTQIMTAPRRVEVSDRLEALLDDLSEQLEEGMPFIQQVQDNLPDLQPNTPSWAFLLAALIGEMRIHDSDE
ncbi:MAG: hypothetical protein KF770_01085 [Anaerolineae bacterium]|nr:hypothetical protein [Anaerolineae bacterium]